MLGAIVGDIVGSRFERRNHRSKDFELFAEGCRVTDDSVMTLAIARAVMEAYAQAGISDAQDHHALYAALSDRAVACMREIGRQYPHCGYGGMFLRWLFSEQPEPYQSYGNGSAMRVSPAGFIAKDEYEAADIAEALTAVTHDHEEGIKGAQATAAAVCLARRGATKAEIRKHISDTYYPLDFRIDDIRPHYEFNATCQGSVPQAITCFLESGSFDDAIRTAVSLGGDSDTIAAIAGAIAEAYYGVPQAIGERALSYLDDRLRGIYDRWTAFAPACGEPHRVMTKYIGRLSEARMTGGNLLEPMDDFPLAAFEADWLEGGLAQRDYGDALAAMGLPLDADRLIAQDVGTLSTRQVLALITAAFRNEHFSGGAMERYLSSGAMLRWLKRLKDIDWQKHPRDIVTIELMLYSMMMQSRHAVRFGGSDRDQVHTERSCGFSGPIAYGHGQIEDAQERLKALHFEYWLASYPQRGDMRVLDGEQWSLSVRYSDGYALHFDGDNTYPMQWEALLDFLGIEGEDEDAVPERQTDELVFVSVRLGEGRSYWYLSEEDSLSVGDAVIVPVGTDQQELMGLVENIAYALPEHAPYPLEKIKRVIRRSVE